MKTTEMLIPSYMTLVKGCVINDTFKVCKVTIEVTQTTILIDTTSKLNGKTETSHITFKELAEYKKWYMGFMFSKHKDFNQWRIRERHGLKRYYQDEQGRFKQI